MRVCGTGAREVAIGEQIASLISPFLTLKMDRRLRAEYTTAQIGWVEVLALHSERTNAKCYTVKGNRKIT